MPPPRRSSCLCRRIERRKNHDILYRAWLRLIEAGCTIPNLVFVGMRGWGVDDLLSDLARDRRIRGRIHVLQTVSDTELAMLYDRCLYTVYPSLYEGWGLPVVESFAFGKFCLCSNAGSLPEAGGDLAEYLDPWDLNAWVERIQIFRRSPGGDREKEPDDNAAVPPAFVARHVAIHHAESPGACPGGLAAHGLILALPASRLGGSAVPSKE